MDALLRQLIQNVVDRVEDSGNYGDLTVSSRVDIAKLADYLIAHPVAFYPQPATHNPQPTTHNP